MAAKIILSPRQNSFKFSDRVLSLDTPSTIGRSGGKEPSASHNAIFDSKVLSKSHAVLLCGESSIYIIDTGSSNGTFVNNIRLSKAGKESAPTEVFTGDILKFGSEVEDKNKKVIQKPVVAKITIFKEDRVDTRERTPTSILFRPSESQEDVTMVGEIDESPLSRESMVLLKEKLLEMQKGMEFLSYKENDYIELQQLAEEEAETICELEKENYKLRHALKNIENKIALEKSKYMQLAEYEAETICNLEKENYKLIDSLNTAEETIKNEREKNRALQDASKTEMEILQNSLHEAVAEVDLKNKSLAEAQHLLDETKKNVLNLEKENLNLNSQDFKLLDAPESDYDLLVKAELNTLTESRRPSEANRDENETDALASNSINIQAENMKGNKTEINSTRQDLTLLMIIAWISFMVGYLIEDVLYY
eukprot:TRINITY_DN4931_c0_g1_i4.p1 TRINITY_DN4931_c0_g1~~TRINITY_DN4931_c0_g1_i4.p1  ORF type:complete len:444 (-),score=147.93 TRINITY_DN4931_c0_g1_i4:96-1364(-)